MATKKISELPLINALSGSQLGGTLIPVVVSGTTDRISAEDFSKFVTAYSAHTGSAGNTFTGPQIINNNVTITGKLTVNEVVAVYETASVIYSEGGNIFGNELTDKQQLTGSVSVTGSLITNGNLVLNGTSLNNSFDRLHQATGSLENFTSSQAARNLNLSIVTGSVNTFTASQDNRNYVISQFTASTNAHIVGISNFTSSNFDTMARVYQTTSSLQAQTSSLLAFTASQVDRNTNLSIVTGSINRFTSSQDDRNYVISQYTASTDAHIVGVSIYTSSVDNHIVGISQFTSSILAQNAGVASVTASLNAFTASQDSRNYVISQFTSSTNAHIVGISSYTSSNESWKTGVRGEISAIEAWTASLDNTYATDAQLYQLYQATRSIELTTGSLIGITNGLMAFTAALDNTYATDAQLYQLYQATRSIELHSGSMVGITNGLMAYTSSNETWKTGIRGEISGIEAWTASLDSTYATDAQLLPILQATRSLELHSGSLVGITNGLMALTASIKSQAIVSSSQQIKDYIDFVNNSVTSSMSVQSASFAAKIWTPSGTANQVLYQSAGGASSNTTTDSNFTWTAGTSTLGVKNLAIPYNGTLQSSLDATNNISLHDGVFGLIKITNGSADRITLYRNTDTIKLSGSLVIDSNNASAKHEITGSLNVNNGITGSFKGDLVGTATLATNASNIALLRDNTDTTLYPVFSAGIAGDTYSTLRGHTSGTLYYNGLTQQLIVSGGGLVVTGSSSITGSSTIIGKETITGSLLITGSITIASGSITMPNRPAFRLIGDGGQIIAPYTISGSRVVMDYNQGNHYNATTGLFRAPIAGLYQVNLVVRTHSNTNSTINQAIVYKSGSNTGGDVAQIMVEYGVNTTMNHSGGSTISYLDVGDTLKAVVAVGTCSFDSNDNFSVAYIG